MDVQGKRSRVIALVLFMMAGCRSVETTPAKVPEPGPAPVHHAVTTWGNQIVTTSDVVHQGAALPGVAGRLYLLGEDQVHLVKGNGKVIVDLYENGQANSSGQPKMLARWEYDKDTLDKLFRKDFIGWGYTLFLPWPDYHPDIKRVQIRASYVPENGSAVFAPQNQMCLKTDNVGPIIREQTMLASHQVPATTPATTPATSATTSAASQTSRLGSSPGPMPALTPAMMSSTPPKPIPAAIAASSTPKPTAQTARTRETATTARMSNTPFGLRRLFGQSSDDKAP